MVTLGKRGAPKTNDWNPTIDGWSMFFLFQGAWFHGSMLLVFRGVNSLIRFVVLMWWVRFCEEFEAPVHQNRFR